MNYEELDAKTRGYMLNEFEAEESSGAPYRSKALSTLGLHRFPGLMRAAIKDGDDVSLCRSLQSADLWELEEEYVRNSVARRRRRNVEQSAYRLALTEFSTWYVRGLAKRLLDEGVENCQIYRGANPKWEPSDCAEHEGAIVSVRSVYENHRRRYWPEPGDSTVLSVPFAPGCHHLIRRVAQANAA